MERASFGSRSNELATAKIFPSSKGFHQVQTEPVPLGVAEKGVLTWECSLVPLIGRRSGWHRGPDEDPFHG